VKTRTFVLAAGAFAAVMCVVAAVVLGGQAQADASALSRGSRGFLAARRYLEERGCRVVLLDRELDAAPAGTLVLAFPWQQPGFDDPVPALERRLRDGGTVVLAYAGSRFDPVEGSVARAFGLEWDTRPGPPVNPLRWPAYARRESTLVPDPPDAGGIRPVRVAETRRLPRAPEDAAVLVRDEAGRPAAFAFRRYRGRVVVVPADAFSNARLSEPGNADLLETLRQDLGDRWTFDELHHGLSAPEAAAAGGRSGLLWAYLGQVGFVYLLAVAAVARRFGPAWREGAVASGSAASFLVGLGTLHDRLGHHDEAARLLVARATELDRRLGLTAADADDTEGFLALARRVALAQAGKRRTT
jgi:hypothetical protein